MARATKLISFLEESEGDGSSQRSSSRLQWCSWMHSDFRRENTLEFLLCYVSPGLDPRVHFVDVETSEVHVLATLLDPRYKTSGFMDKAKAEEAKGKLASVASNIFERSLAEGSFQINADSPAKSCWDAILSDSDGQSDSVNNNTICGEEDTIRNEVKHDILHYFADKKLHRG
ncbi:hypothetical protein LOD99_796 [Oopsacas minuta]|uniref:Uncharacterized protein n=1 Tax=Oopsacas minuta TaxID=111878 RepID=A0AAV7K1B7_9METZ|nr:hypothetical protein LOD99_796 [Oopsacas minuta]